MRNWFQFQVERLAQLGTASRLMLILAMLAMLTVTGGLTAYVIGDESLPTVRSALWWALLRMADFGYLEQDADSFGLAAVSLTLSICGTAFLVGGVAAVMTTSVNQRLAKLAEGTTPVPFRDHTVIIGWNDRTAHIVAWLLRERPRQRVVVLAQQLKEREEPLSVEIMSLLSNPSLTRNIVYRSGSPTRPAHLGRAACARASAIIVPESGVDAGDPDNGPRWLRRMAALNEALDGTPEDKRPRIVVEHSDAKLLPIAQRLVPQAEFVDGNRIAAEALVEAIGIDEGESRVLSVGDTRTGSVCRELLESRNVSVETVPADSMSHRDASVMLDDIADFDRILLMAERDLGDATDADEETMASVLVLGTAQLHPQVRIVAQLLDPDSTELFESTLAECSITPRNVANALAKRALTP